MIINQEILIEKDDILKRFKNNHTNTLRNLMNDFYHINDTLEKVKIVTKIYETIIENVEDINYVSLNYYDKFRDKAIDKIPFFIEECNNLIKNNNSLKDIIIYQKCINILKKGSFELNHNYKRSKMDIIREDICIKAFHPRFFNKLWTFED